MIDLCVIGAGATGLGAAYAAARHEHTVAVFDLGAPQAPERATIAAAGMLLPDVEALDPELRRWARLAFDRHWTLADQLGGPDKVELRRVHVAHQLPSAPDWKPAAYAAALDPVRLSATLIAECARAGCEFHWHEAVTSFRTSEDTGIHVVTDRRTILARSVIVATGFRLNELAPHTVGQVEPDRGILLEFEGESISAFPPDLVVFRHDPLPPTYALRRGARLAVGATSAAGDSRSTADSQEVAELLARARTLLPGFDLDEPVQIHVGHRPMGRDAWPMLAIGDLPIVFAGAAWRNGILFGPLLGELAAGLAQRTLDPATLPPALVRRYS